MKNCCNGAFVAPIAAFKICDMECDVNFSFQLLDITVIKVNILVLEAVSDLYSH
jgi:hypothetical protein